MNSAVFYSDVSYGSAIASAKQFGYITLLQQTRMADGRFKVIMRRKK